MSKKLVVALPYSGGTHRITVPSGVLPTATAYLWGGGGGGGGDDSPGVGGNGAAGQAYKVTFPIQEGDVIDLSPGGGGGFGSSNSASSLAARGQTLTPGYNAITIPSGVSQVSVILEGGGGGGGALDYGGLGQGNNGTPGKKLTGIIPVTAGDTLEFYIGTGGQGGIASRNNKTQRTAGGTNSLLGNGGEAGLLIVSGQGGGGGAASVIKKNGSIYAIAAGGGGGGGSGSYGTGRVRTKIEYTTSSNGEQGATVGDAGSGGGGGGGLYGGKGGAAGGGDTGAYQGSQGRSQIPTGWTEIDSNNGAVALKLAAGLQQPNGGDGTCVLSYTEFVGARDGGKGGQGYVGVSDRFGGGNGGVCGPIGASGAGGGGGGASVLVLNGTVIAVAAGGGGGGGGGNRNTYNGDSAVPQANTDSVATVGQNGQDRTGDGGGAGGGGGGRFGGVGGTCRPGYDEGGGAGGSGVSWRKTDWTTSGDVYIGSATTPPSVDGYSVGPAYASGGTRRNVGANGYIIIEFYLYALPYVNVGSTWYPSRRMYVNITNNWKEITAGYIKLGGVWKPLVQGREIAPSSLGSGVNYGAGGTRAR